MADGVGMAFAVTRMVLDLYNKIKNSSTEFHHLDQDLKSFHQALVLSEHYLVQLNGIRDACEELVADIKILLSTHKSRNILERVILLYEDIEPLKMRITLQISALHLCVDELRHRGHGPGDSRLIQSSQISDDTLNEVNRLVYDLFRQALRNIAINESIPNHVKAIVAKRPPYSASTLNVSFNIASSSRSTETLTSTHSTHSFSNSTRSVIPTQRDSSSSLSLIESQISQQRTQNLKVAKEDHIGTLSELLISVARTPIELPVDTEHVKELLCQGASLEYRDAKLLRTPLIWAITGGRKDLVEIFLEEEEVHLETCDGVWGWTPTIWAVMEKQAGILDVLISNGADLGFSDANCNRTALLWAASIGNYEAAELLLKKDSNLINVKDKEGKTALAIAYFEGHLETAHLLLRSGDDANFIFESGFSLLEWAIFAKNEDFARLLLEHRADAKSTNVDGVCVLILAIHQDLPDVVELLLEKGADVQATDEKGIPALIIAVKNQNEKISEILVRWEANLETRDGEENTALLWAVWRNNEALVKILVKGKADLTAVDSEGKSVREWADWTRNDDIIQLVALKGPDD